MLSDADHVLIEAALAIFRDIHETLARIADALEAEHEPAPVAAESAACEHPESKRVDLGDGDWECSVLKRGCGYRCVAEELKEA